MRRLLFSILIPCCLVLTNYAGTDPPVVHEDAKLTASDAAPSDLFGSGVAISGDTAVIGAYGDDHAGGENAGSAYVFVRDGTTWTEQAKLTKSDAGYGYDLFGTSVAISGDTVVMGAPAGWPRLVGSAYVFVRDGTTWTEQAKLSPTDAWDWIEFGSDVAISGDTAVVGAKMDDYAGLENSGSAYVFVRSGTTWTYQRKLIASDATAYDLFGSGVAISGDTVVVGASYDDHAGGENAGSVYVLVRDGPAWPEQAKLTASDAADGDRLPRSVAFSGDTVVVGASYDDHAGGEDAGSAYVFVRDGTTWTEQAKLTASDAADGLFFGNHVAISGDTVVVGASYDDHAGGENAGSAYVFVRSGTTWTERAKLTASDAADGDRLGGHVAISGDTVVVGALSDDHAGGENAGSAYVFRLPLPVAIDIKPGSHPNSVNPRSWGVIPVALLGSEDFDVHDVDVTTLAFGAAGAAPRHDLSDEWTYTDHLQDVNLDGFVDLVMHYETQETGILCGDDEAALTGELLDGRQFIGTDEIVTVGCPPPQFTQPTQQPESVTTAPATESSVFGRNE